MAAIGDTLLLKINNLILTPVVRLLFALAFLYFFYGVVKFIRSADDPEERKTGAKHIMWGVVGIAIMFTAVALIRIILQTFGIQ